MTDSSKYPDLDADEFVGEITLGELVRWGITLLETLPEDTKVIMSSDPEGNSFDTLFQGEVRAFTRSGREIDIPYPDDIEDDDPPEDVGVVLWP